MPIDLWMLRHPKVDVAPGICYGGTDVPLHRDHAELCVNEWANALPNGIELWHSTLSRCEQPSQWIRRPRADISLKSDVRLIEMHFGAWEMRPWADVGLLEMDAWTRDFADHRPGGGERVSELMARVASAMADVVARCTRQGQTSAAWLTHAGVIRAANLIAAGREVCHAADWPNEPIEYGSIQVLRIDTTLLKPMLYQRNQRL